jgi:hypothetical protein
MILQTDTPIVTNRANFYPEPEERWHQTPLDFLSRDEWFCSRLWRYYVQVLHYLHIPMFARPKTEPWDYIPSDSFLCLDKKAEIIFAPCILSFVGMYMFPWNFDFPTPTERLLWRVAAVYLIFYGIAGSLTCLYSK